MKITKTDPDKYIEELPHENAATIRKLDEIIRKEAPEVAREMWEGKFWGGSEQKIIGYGKYRYTNSKKEESEWFVVGLALQKNYITVYVNAVVDKQYLAEKYKDKLGKAKVGKSSISFRSLDDVNIEVLAEVVKKSFK